MARRLRLYGLADDGQRSSSTSARFRSTPSSIEGAEGRASAIYARGCRRRRRLASSRQQFTRTSPPRAPAGRRTLMAVSAVGWGDSPRTNTSSSPFDMRQSRTAASVHGPSGRASGQSRSRGSAARASWATMRPVSASSIQAGARGAFFVAARMLAVEPRRDGFCRWGHQRTTSRSSRGRRTSACSRGARTRSTTRLRRTPEFSYLPVEGRASSRRRHSTWYNTSTGDRAGARPTSPSGGPPDNPYASSRVARPRNTTRAPTSAATGSGLHGDNTQRYLVGIIKGTSTDGTGTRARCSSATTDSRSTGYLNYQHLLRALNGIGGYGYYRIGANASLNSQHHGFISPRWGSRYPSRNMQVDIKASRDITSSTAGRWRSRSVPNTATKLDNPGKGRAAQEIMGLGYSSAPGGAQRDTRSTASCTRRCRRTSSSPQRCAALPSDYSSNWA